MARRKVGLGARSQAFKRLLLRGGGEAARTYADTLKSQGFYAIWPLHEDLGYTATNVSDNAGLDGTHARVRLAATEGPDGGNAVQYVPDDNSLTNVLTDALKGLFSGDEGALLVWIKPREASVIGSGNAWLVRLVGANGGQLQTGRSTNWKTERKAGGISKDAVYPALPAGDDWTCVLVGYSVSQDKLQTWVNGQPGSVVTGNAAWNEELSGAYIGAHSSQVREWDGYLAWVALADRFPDDAMVQATYNIPTAAQAYTGPNPLNPNRFRPDNTGAHDLTIPTYDGSGEAVHPDVYDAGEGNTWNGYRYWMAMTPYPGGDASYENPSILASDDGETWVVPTGLTNPIEPQPGSGINSDPDLTMIDGTLYCVWRWANPGTAAKFYCLSSTDGVTWGNKTEIVDDTTKGSDLSPSIVQVGSTFYMYTRRKGQNPSVFCRTASAITGPWSEPVAVAGSGASDTSAHVDALYVPEDGENGIIYLHLTPGLIATIDAADPFTAYLPDYESRTYGVYRSTIVRTATGFDVWSSYHDVGANDWIIARTAVVEAW